jgi:hypothetical protein
VPEQVIGLLIVALLLGVAGWFGWRQAQTLRALPRQANLSSEDRRYFRNQAWRRLVGCALMFILAGLLAGWFLLGLNETASRLADRAKGAGAGAPPLTPEEEHSLRVCAYYLGGLLLVLLATVGTAWLDFWAIRRYGLRHRRQIQDERRAMIERQVARLRQEGNGQDG